jgi:hypothetical protein
VNQFVDTSAQTGSFNTTVTRSIHRRLGFFDISDICWSSPKVSVIRQEKVKCTGCVCEIPLPDSIIINFDEPGFMLQRSPGASMEHHARLKGRRIGIGQMLTTKTSLYIASREEINSWIPQHYRKQNPGLRGNADTPNTTVIRSIHRRMGFYGITDLC